MEGKKEIIYQAVLSLIREEYDYHDITISLIAQRAGIGKGTVYEYFRSKDEIFIDAVLFFVKEQMDRISLATEEGDFQTRFYHLLRAAEDCLRENQTLFNLMFLKSIKGFDSKLSTRVADGQRQLQKQLNTLLDGLVKAGQAEGILAEKLSLIDISFAIFSVMGLMSQYICDDSIQLLACMNTEELHTFCYQKFVKILS